MAKSKKTSDAFDMADDIRKEVAAESVADACSTSVPAIYSLAKGDNPRRAKYDKNADVIGYNLRLPANIHRLLKRHCMETKAAQVRKARKELKENIKSGKTDPASVLKTRKDDPLVSKMKVKEFLQAIPGIGGAKADKIMHDVDIPGNRRLGGLGIRQAEALLEYLS